MSPIHFIFLPGGDATATIVEYAVRHEGLPLLNTEGHVLCMVRVDGVADAVPYLRYVNSNLISTFNS